MKPTIEYTLQLRFVAMENSLSHSELEVLAHPCIQGHSAQGQPSQGRFLQWEPILEKICSWVSPSAFHRKAVQRTLTAGLTADLINRETGNKHVFSAEEIAWLSLTPAEAQALLNSDLSTAA